MTEQEILDEITLVSTAIHNLLKTGQKYEIGTGQSKRVFEMADLDKLKALRYDLQRDLVDLQNDGGGVVLGY